MTAIIIVDCQHIEEEGLHIVIQGFVVEEEFGEQTQVLAVDLIRIAVYLKHGQVFCTIDLIGWRMVHITLLLHTVIHESILDALEIKHKNRNMVYHHNIVLRRCFQILLGWPLSFQCLSST